MNYNKNVHFFTKKYTIRRTVMINTLKDFIEIVQDNTRQNFNYFFRGQCNEFPPVPSVFRDGFIEKEDYLYHELILRCPEHFSGLPHLDTLVLMQHYGLPTRLLDVTTNPLVALYFACKDYSNKHDNHPGYLYIYGVDNQKVAYSDSDRVLMLSCLPMFSLKEKNKMLNIIDENINNGNIKITSKNTYPAAVERLFHEITKEVPAFKREIDPFDLVSPIFVKPMRSNARIIKQDGAFIISGLCADKNEAVKKIRYMCSNTIKINERGRILRELDDFGINEASLFPEVDKVADYLKAKCNLISNERFILSV